ncbi:MAG: ATP-NAD kinase family protein [Candidatus Lokiarchaeota archaeon]|nr:ATP-NAD kinase family protein [Candidatus Lokiarchaeota archaeon]
MEQFILGLIINPIAGMGGAVGLKGTDGKEILEKALSLGAKPNSYNRTKELLINLKSIKKKILFLTCPKFMGEYILEDLGFNYDVIEHPIFDNYKDIYDTTAENTKIAVNLLNKNHNLKLLIFVGGDGTARDVQSVIDKQKPCIGVPAGVKIYSGVFARKPKLAADLIIKYLWEEVPLCESEVLDIDEKEYREGRLVSRQYGVLLTPFEPNYSQSSKMGTPNSDMSNQERIAKRIVENMENDIYYLLGPGTTIKAITDLLNQEKSLLGVDLLLNNKIIAFDLNEKDILEFINKKPMKIIVSPIGRQGFLFGRGNLQFSSNIIEKVGLENILILSTKYKLENIPDCKLKLDTRDSKLDNKMKGFYKIIVDYDEVIIYKIE